ncbi:maleylacetoacetate isomerase [Actimicrobium sp. GrIS 1.19]|uniref:maleylacetoacetate isomerase n=1 Tax=Actimicrobium sp. GrIS 1.19 TaxID=3071708 RepID=UPI002E05DC07|nr:maleylacetoacetate isomerase [Actimicrobium sp. GrIS 1.19]
MKLHEYFRSSASFRVRIALNLKGLQYESVGVNLVRDGGQQLTPAYRALNPDGLVPALVDDSQAPPLLLTQSLAIIEYLDEAYPTPPLLPTGAADRAWVRGIALAIACDIHPVNNLRVLRYLVRDLHHTEDEKNAWYRHWCEQGLAALEVSLARDPRVGQFCFGDTPTLADCCLVPQLWNAQRFNCDMSAMPTLLRINQACVERDAFRLAMPALQPDAE